jgi:hypothetical protein
LAAALGVRGAGPSRRCVCVSGVVSACLCGGCLAPVIRHLDVCVIKPLCPPCPVSYPKLLFRMLVVRQAPQRTYTHTAHRQHPQVCSIDNSIDLHIIRWRTSRVGGAEASVLSLEKTPRSRHLTLQPQRLHRNVIAFQRRTGLLSNGAHARVCVCVFLKCALRCASKCRFF